MKKFITIITLFAVMLTMLAASNSVAAQEEEMNPAEVVAAVYAAVGAGDIESAVSMLADDAVLVLIPPPQGLDGTFIGKEEIGAWYQGLAAGNGRSEFSDISVAGNTASMKLAFYHDSFEGLGIAPAEFDGVAVVQDGLVKSLSWVFTPAFAAKMDAAMALAGNKDVVRRYLEAFEQADVKTLDALLGADFVNHSLPLPPDREGVKAFATEQRSQFPTGEYTIDQLVAEGDLVLIYGHYRGTHDGEPFMGIPASGAEASFDFSTLLRLKDGKIIERWGTADDVMGMLVPLGFKLVPPEK